jgi:hypothetical protein
MQLGQHGGDHLCRLQIIDDAETQIFQSPLGFETTATTAKTRSVPSV